MLAAAVGVGGGFVADFQPPAIPQLSQCCFFQREIISLIHQSVLLLLFAALILLDNVCGKAGPAWLGQGRSPEAEQTVLAEELPCLPGAGMKD